MTKLTGLRRSLLDAPVQDLPLQDGQVRAGQVADEVVPVPMTAVDRRRVRRRLTAPDGTELLIALPTGTVLMPGHVLAVLNGVSYVVTAAPEDVAVVQPRDLAEAARVAHAVGNLHRDFVGDADVFLALWDAPMELLLTRLGVPFTRDSRPFHGRPGWEHEP